MMTHILDSSVLTPLLFLAAKRECLVVQLVLMVVAV